MKNRHIALAGMLAFAASAAALAADSLICESAETLEFVNRHDDMKGRRGST